MKTKSKKSPTGKRSTRLFIRVTVAEKSKIEALSKIYARGNVSTWVVYGALNAPREFLK